MGCFFAPAPNFRLAAQHASYRNGVLGAGEKKQLIPNMRLVSEHQNPIVSHLFPLKGTLSWVIPHFQTSLTHPDPTIHFLRCKAETCKRPRFNTFLDRSYFWMRHIFLLTKAWPRTCVFLLYLPTSTLGYFLGMFAGKQWYMVNIPLQRIFCH